MVRGASHSHPILHDLQLLLDVLRGNSSSPGTRCGVHKGIYCHANLLRHRMDPADDFRHDLWRFTMEKPRRKPTVSNDSIGLEIKINDIYICVIFIAAGSRRVNSCGSSRFQLFSS